MEGEPGVIPYTADVVEALTKHIAFLEHMPVVIEFREESPRVIASQLEANKALVLAHFPDKIDLLYDSICSTRRR